MSLLIVGSVAFDSIETPFGRVGEVLGGSAIYSSISASYFTEPSIVAVVGTDFKKEYLKRLENRGIDVSGIQFVEGKTFRWKGHYLYDLNCAHTLETQLNVFESFSPVLSQNHRKIKNIFLANIDPELQYRVYKQIVSPQIVAADTMNFWITNKPKELKKLLKIVDIFLLNEAELRQLAEESNIIKAAKSVLKMGPKILIIKRGEYGAMYVSKDKIFMVPSYPVEKVFDPTGAGDSFAGAFLGYLVKSKKINDKVLRQAIIFGSVMGSFCVEDFSIKKISKIKNEDIILRYRKIKELVHFEDLERI